MTHPFRSVAALVIIAVALAGCGSAEPADDDVPTQHYSQAAQITIDVAGHSMTRFEGEWRIQVLRAEVPDGASLLVVGTDKPVAAGQWMIEAFVELVDFRGDGDYRAQPPGEGATPALVNDAYVQLTRGAGPGGTPTEGFRYDQVVKPCEFTISRSGAEGTAACGGLASSGGGEVTLRMSWSGRGPRTSILESPSPSPTVAS